MRAPNPPQILNQIRAAALLEALCCSSMHFLALPCNIYGGVHRMSLTVPVRRSHGAA
jgi:hypothetical protein